MPLWCVATVLFADLTVTLELSGKVANAHQGSVRSAVDTWLDALEEVGLVFLEESAGSMIRPILAQAVPFLWNSRMAFVNLSATVWLLS